MVLLTAAVANIEWQRYSKERASSSTVTPAEVAGDHWIRKNGARVYQTEKHVRKSRIEIKRGVDAPCFALRKAGRLKLNLTRAVLKPKKSI